MRTPRVLQVEISHANGMDAEAGQRNVDLMERACLVEHGDRIGDFEDKAFVKMGKIEGQNRN